VLAFPQAENSMFEHDPSGSCLRLGVSLCSLAFLARFSSLFRIHLGVLCSRAVLCGPSGVFLCRRSRVLPFEGRRAAAASHRHQDCDGEDARASLAGHRQDHVYA
jgi:hypothetical protein